MMPPVQRRAAGAADRELAAAAAKVEVPSMGLIVSGVLMLLLHGGFVLYFLQSSASPTNEVMMLFGIGIPVAALIVVGGIQMRLLQTRGLAVLGAIAALIPLGPLWMLSFPFGIWSLIVLNHPSMQNVFGKRMEPEPDEDIPGRLLLDETDYMARQLQLVAVPFANTLIIGGIIAWFVLPQVWFVGTAALIAGGVLHWLSGQTKQQWDVVYRKHKIRFDNSELPSGKLFIDKELVATGSGDLTAVLRGQIQDGEGAGDVIVARTNAGLWTFRLRLFAQPAGSGSMPAAVVYSRSESPPPMEAELVPDEAPPPISEARPMKPAEPATLNVLPTTAFPRRFIKGALWLIVPIAILLFLSFDMSAHRNGGVEEFVTTVGAGDPWLKFVRTQTHDPASNVFTGSSHSTNFNILSWSLFAFVVGVVCVSAAWRMEREDSGKVAVDPAWWRSFLFKEGGALAVFLLLISGRMMFNTQAGGVTKGVQPEIGPLVQQGEINFVPQGTGDYEVFFARPYSGIPNLEFPERIWVEFRDVKQTPRGFTLHVNSLSRPSGETPVLKWKATGDRATTAEEKDLLVQTGKVPLQIGDIDVHYPSGYSAQPLLTFPKSAYVEFKELVQTPTGFKLHVSSLSKPSGEQSVLEWQAAGERASSGTATSTIAAEQVTAEVQPN
jgi:hypothetical protein